MSSVSTHFLIFFNTFSIVLFPVFFWNVAVSYSELSENKTRFYDTPERDRRPKKFLEGGTTVIVLGNGIGDTNLLPGRDCKRLTLNQCI